MIPKFIKWGWGSLPQPPYLCFEWSMPQCQPWQLWLSYFLTYHQVTDLFMCSNVGFLKTNITNLSVCDNEKTQQSWMRVRSTRKKAQEDEMKNSDQCSDVNGRFSLEKVGWSHTILLKHTEKLISCLFPTFGSWGGCRCPWIHRNIGNCSLLH